MFRKFFFIGILCLLLLSCGINKENIVSNTTITGSKIIESTATGITYLHNDNNEVTLLIESDTNEALKIALNDYEKYDGKNFRNLEKLLRIYLDLNKFDKAIQYGEKRLKINIEPDSDFPSELAYGYIMNDESDKALKIMKKYSSFEKIYYFPKGLIEYYKGNHKTAIDLFKKINNKDDRYIEGLFFTGKSYFELKEYKTSEQFYNKLILEGEKKDGWFNIFSHYYGYSELINLHKILSNNLLIIEYTNKLNDYNLLLDEGKIKSEDGLVVSKQFITKIKQLYK